MSSSSDEEIVLNGRTRQAVRRSSRSHVPTKNASRINALEVMRKARETGTTHRIDVENLIKPVYEEVDEKDYMDIVRQRQNADFVVDDDGSGYVDGGLDIWDDEEALLGPPSSGRTKKKKKDHQKRGAIDSFLCNAAPKRFKDENSLTVSDDPELQSMLNEFENPLNDTEIEKESTENHTPHLHPSRNQLIIEQSPPSGDATSFRTTKPLFVLESNKIKFSTVSLAKSSENHGGISKRKKISELKSGAVEDHRTEISATVLVQNSEVHKSQFCPLRAVSDNAVAKPKESSPVVSVKSELLNSEDESLFEPSDTAESTVKVLDTEEKDVFKEESTEISRDCWTRAESASNDDTSILNHTNDECLTKSFIEKNLEGKPVIRFYWLDAFEDPVKHPGVVYLFGRVLNKGSSESICIIAKNIWRQIFVLPRKTKFIKGVNTSEQVSMLEVNEEMQGLLRSHGVTTVKCKPVEKKFAYNNGIIPKNAEVLEMQYPSAYTKLPHDLTGETFSNVFNTTATAMEKLLLVVGLHGPSWIEVTNFVLSSPCLGYAKHEYIVDMERMNSIQVSKCEDRPPTVSFMAINILSVQNKAKENEIVLISCVRDPKCNLHKPTADRSVLQRFCLVSKPGNRAYPFDLKNRLTEKSLEASVHLTTNERHLLNQFLCKLQVFDPDILLGHDMSSQLSLLVSRMEKLKIAQWSRMSRLKRSVHLRQLGHSKAAHWELTAGRLVLDSRSSAMEFVKCRSFDLPELSSALLNLNYETLPAVEIPNHFTNSSHMIKLFNYGWNEAWTSLAVLSEINALPLFVQITQIVGGVLSRTLFGGRAERSEFLLLHAFHKAGYVAPDKRQSDRKKKGDKNSEDRVDESVDEKTGHKISKKGQYAGGLVLEPKRGLYDTFVLLLDFNSLYPSIIQEFNICFTTVDQSKLSGEDELPDLPQSQEEGILPREIRVLVERRKEVKKLMKDERLAEHKRHQYDIRQMGLKLTANSLYGCLGFTQSRFYAKSLAALITSQGREILMHTKDLVEKQGCSVIYGDTDSIMIDTGLHDLDQVMKLGVELKKLVNKCHKKLELDIDGIYKKLLLLKKKKYAALAVSLIDMHSVKKEMKGLDIVRRDWSVLAKELGNEVIDLLLSSVSRDGLVENIHDLLRNLRLKLDNNEVDIDKFEILKQLTKDPAGYNDIKSQPHVAVAQRLNATGKFNFHSGDIVKYIICKDETGNSAMQRAYHRVELESNENLKIDTYYYLAHQIHPVICRLCEPIEEINPMCIADALGLDSSLYKKYENVKSDSIEGNGLNVGLQVDFSHCVPLTLKCPSESCDGIFEVRSTFIQDDSKKPKLWMEECPKCSSSLLNHLYYIMFHLRMAFRAAIMRYYRSAFVCDDIACSYRTRRRVLKWSREGVTCPKCATGVLRREYTSQMLFEQESFFRAIFNFGEAVDQLDSTQKHQIRTRNDFSQIVKIHEKLFSLCNEFLELNDYNQVSLAYLFANMRRK